MIVCTWAKKYKKGLTRYHQAPPLTKAHLDHFFLLLATINLIRKTPQLRNATPSTEFSAARIAALGQFTAFALLVNVCQGGRAATKQGN